MSRRRVLRACRVFAPVARETAMARAFSRAAAGETAARHTRGTANHGARVLPVPDVAHASQWQGQAMSATEPLSPLDATFLELEDADPTAHMHIGGVLVFDALPGGGTPTLARVRRHLERRLDALPRYRQKLSRRGTGGLRWPEWEPDERFDIAAHVTRAALPKPGGERELLEWAADFWSHRLDRARPLWRAG